MPRAYVERCRKAPGESVRHLIARPLSCVSSRTGGLAEWPAPQLQANVENMRSPRHCWNRRGVRRYDEGARRRKWSSKEELRMICCRGLPGGKRNRCRIQDLDARRSSISISRKHAKGCSRDKASSRFGTVIVTTPQYRCNNANSCQAVLVFFAAAYVQHIPGPSAAFNATICPSPRDPRNSR